MKAKRVVLSAMLATTVGLGAFAAPSVHAQELRVGVLATLEGSLTPLGH